MKIYPVLDIQKGIVVHALRGERNRYQPLRSQLVDSAEPLTVARALRSRFDSADLYLADLDALAGAPPAADIWTPLLADGFRLILDAGVRSLEQADSLARLGVESVVIALETLPSPDVMGEIVVALGSDRTVFSLDLKAGKPLGDLTPWKTDDPQAIGSAAYDLGVRRMIVLDLAQVGSARGPAQLGLIGHLKDQFPDLQIITGGGVRNAEDLAAFDQAGVSGVLVATALHDGSLEL